MLLHNLRCHKHGLEKNIKLLQLEFFDRDESIVSRELAYILYTFSRLPLEHVYHLVTFPPNAFLISIISSFETAMRVSLAKSQNIFSSFSVKMIIYLLFKWAYRSEEVKKLNILFRKTFIFFLNFYLFFK
jgi:hypothetical protein